MVYPTQYEQDQMRQVVATARLQTVVAENLDLRGRCEELLETVHLQADQIDMLQERLDAARKKVAYLEDRLAQANGDDDGYDTTEQDDHDAVNIPDDLRRYLIPKDVNAAWVRHACEWVHYGALTPEAAGGALYKAGVRLQAYPQHADDVQDALWEIQQDAFIRNIEESHLRNSLSSRIRNGVAF